MDSSNLRTVRQAVLEVQDISPLSEAGLRSRLASPSKYGLDGVAVRIDGRILLNIKVLRDRLILRGPKAA